MMIIIIIIHGAMILRRKLKEKGVKIWTGLIWTMVQYMANKT